MKHGGHKDLIELVSLARIEREVVVRGRWRVDALVRKRERILLSADCSGDENEESKWLETDHEHLVMEEQPPPPLDTIPAAGKKFGFSMHAITTTNTKKKTSRPILNRMHQTLRTVFNKSSLSQQQDQQLLVTQINNQISQIQNAASQIQIRIPAFKMIYISPMHLREREEELVNSGKFRAERMKRRGAFKSTANVMRNMQPAAVDKSQQKQQQQQQQGGEEEEDMAQLESIMSRCTFIAASLDG